MTMTCVHDYETIFESSSWNVSFTTSSEPSHREVNRCMAIHQCHISNLSDEIPIHGREGYYCSS